MKLSEIVIGDLHKLSYEKPTTKNLKLEHFNFHGYKIYSEEFLDHDQIYLEIRTQDEELCGWNVFLKILVDDKLYALDQRTVIELKFQNRGVGTMFYHFIIKYIGLKIMSDDLVSSAWKKLYLSLAKKFTTSMIDRNTFKILPYDEKTSFFKK